MKSHPNYFIIVLFLILLISCSTSVTTREGLIRETGSIAISFNDKKLKAINSVTISISADDMESPIIEDITLADLGVPITIYHIPVGQDRHLTFEGFDEEGNLIYFGEAFGIEIFPDQITLVELVLTYAGEVETGGILIQTSIANPPLLIAIITYPMPAIVGGNVNLRAAIEGEQTYSVLWQAEEGIFFDNTSPETIWTAPLTPGSYLISITVSDSESEVSYGFNVEVIEEPLAPGSIVINEVLADPPDDLAGDANNDGIRSTNDDEFVEIVNVTDSEINISGFKIFDSTGIRHEFEEGTVLPSQTAIVVFGGGTPALLGVISHVASTGGLSLSNSGDSVILYDRSNNVVTEMSYGASGGLNQSLTRFPDITGDFVGHSTVSEFLFSPGKKIDGMEF